MLEKDVISEADITRASFPENLILIHGNNKNGPENVQGRELKMFKVELKMFKVESKMFKERLLEQFYHQPKLFQG